MLFGSTIASAEITRARTSASVVPSHGECPVEAIYHEDDVPDQWKDFIALNAEMVKQSPRITEKQEPLADASGTS
jgi:hypothetical protein